MKKLGFGKSDTVPFQLTVETAADVNQPPPLGAMEVHEPARASGAQVTNAMGHSPIHRKSRLLIAPEVGNKLGVDFGASYHIPLLLSVFLLSSKHLFRNHHNRFWESKMESFYIDVDKGCQPSYNVID